MIGPVRIGSSMFHNLQLYVSRLNMHNTSMVNDHSLFQLLLRFGPI